MVKGLQTSNKGESETINIEAPNSSKLNTKVQLSKSSRVFQMPKRSGSKDVKRMKHLKSIRDHSVKLAENESESSEFSTQESETENDSPCLKLNARSFYHKAKTCPSNKSSQFKEIMNSGRLQNFTNDNVGNFSDIHPNNDFENKRSKQRQYRPKKQYRHDDYQEATIKKPTKKFNSRQEKQHFVESYKMKKKTELCKNWELSRRCKFGASCAFAHGEDELVVKVNLPGNYKTKKCKQFHEEGYCPYGNRCQFLHLIIQKATTKFNYSDIVKETLFQYQSRSKVLGSAHLDDLLVKPVRTRRLRVFEQICSDSEQPKSDNWVNASNQSEELEETERVKPVKDSIWAQFAAELNAGKA